jgi:hypothetical protein
MLIHPLTPVVAASPLYTIAPSETWSDPNTVYAGSGTHWAAWTWLIEGITLSTSQPGVIAEKGGAAIFWMIYVYGGSLYVRAGTAASVTGDAEVSWPIVNGTYDIAGCITGVNLTLQIRHPTTKAVIATASAIASSDIASGGSGGTIRNLLDFSGNAGSNRAGYVATAFVAHPGSWNMQLWTAIAGDPAVVLH